MLLWFRTWRRKRTVAAHERVHGSVYDFHGVKVELPPAFSVDLKNALLKNKYEAEEREYVETYLPQGCDVLELGGSVGVLASFTRSKMQSDTKQIVVEAIPELAEICARNLSTHDTASKSKVIQAAVSYQDAKTISFTVGDNPHVGRIGGAGSRTVEVPVVTLEQICETNDLKDFVLICDIEGAELDLFGASAIWRRNCRLIILETHPDDYANGADDQKALIATIAEAGFHVLAESRGVYALGRDN
ncbi:MAG: FkbM family methyltransferase [Pseudomonadota bacterium]